MSKFKTLIPVDLTTIKNSLPPRSFVNGIRLDGENVVIEWENDGFKTPYTVPVEWPDLTKIPAGVVDVKNAPAAKPVVPGRPSAAKMPAFVSGQQTTSQSQPKAKADDAPGVKKKPTSK